MRFDLHVHTSCSFDSTLSLAALDASVRRCGLDGIAVLDHDEIACAQSLQQRADFGVIVGEEISTLQGGIAGLFLTERIPPRHTVRETISRIRGQGGLVMIPHPLSRGTPGKIDSSVLYDILPLVDILEGYNARTPLASDDLRCRQLAQERGLQICAGSDAHFGFEVGRAFTEIDDFVGPSDFLDKLARARLCWTSKTPYVISALTVLAVPVISVWRRMIGPQDTYQVGSPRRQR